MDYLEAQKFLNSLINYEKISPFFYKRTFRLERIREFLNLLDNPQKKLKFLHIAGTKGKGSTAAFCSYILREAGYRVGLYTSPHLIQSRERIRILDPKNLDYLNEFEGMISEEEFSKLLTNLKDHIEEFNKYSKFGVLSFFEVFTALAFLYFLEKKVNFVVLETGLGGRLDATNVVEAVIYAITPISYEHTQILGTTLKDIATEKVQIIKIPKKNICIPFVITAPQDEEVLEVIEKRCKEYSLKLFQLNRDIFYDEVASSLNQQIFNLYSFFREHPQLKTQLLGRYQLLNASVAVGMVEALNLQGFNVSPEAIRRGLSYTRWPGRFHLLGEKPFFLLDGAQNTYSARVLKENIKDLFKYKRVFVIFGACQDKDIVGMLDELKEITTEFIFTSSENPRAKSAKELPFFLDSNNFSVTSTVKEAINLAKDKAYKDDLIVVTGSLFVVGEALSCLKGESLR